MEQGAIPVADLDGSFDLQSTVESGQSYLWDRLDGKMYTTTAAHGGSAWYETVAPRFPRSPTSGPSFAFGRRTVDSSGNRPLTQSRC